MIDIMKYAQPKEKLDLEDGIQITADAQIALDAIGKKLEIMRKLAIYASDPKCDPVKRIEMNTFFSKLKKEINEWAAVNCGGVQILNGSPKMEQ